MRDLKLKSPPIEIDELFKGIFAGEIYTLGRSSSSIKLNGIARAFLYECFPDVDDPRRAKSYYPEDEYRDRLTNAQLSFSKNPDVRLTIEAILQHMKLCTNSVAYEAPNLRAVSSGQNSVRDSELETLVHRDTWYAQPQSQVNLWMGLYDSTSLEDRFCFFLRNFSNPIDNTSYLMDYDEWRLSFIENTDLARKVRPTCLVQPSMESAVRFDSKASEIVAFSGSHLHQTLTNKSHFTRFSIDFRIVRLEDYKSGSGAPNVDNFSKGSALKDFVLPKRFNKIICTG